jgi:hypothetical protein
VSSLKARIATLGRRSPDLSPVDKLSGQVVPAATQTPGNLVQIVPGVGAGLGPLSPLITSDGAEVPATGPGQWDQLIAAGRT